ncbi:hypothetical protein [Celeribacter sp.]|uniref:hypothetical protein n=1 Tax=Celeribacter sp. TaxID=1890673 RepID=UPI003A8D5177
MASLGKVFAVAVLVTGLGAIGFVGVEYSKMSGGFAQAGEDHQAAAQMTVTDADGAFAAAQDATQKAGFFARFKSSEDEGTEIAQVPTEEILTIECNQRGARKSCSVTREVEEIEEVAE